MAVSFCRKTFQNYKNSLFKLQYRSHYVVLIPEIPEDVGDKEILCKTGHLLEFDKVTPKDCKHLMVRKTQMYDVGAWELGDQIQEMLDKNEKIDIFKNVLGPLELLNVPFLSSWGLINTLYYANDEYMPTKMFSPLHNRAIELKCDKFNMEPIYKACKLALENDGDKLSEEEKRILQKYVLEGVRNGMELDEKGKEQFKRIFEQVHMRKNSYYEKYENAMVAFKQVIQDPKVIDDFPPDLLRRTALNVEEPEKGPWILSLEPRIYNRFMEYCDVRQSRLHMWLSKRQICSKHGDPRFRADLEVEDLREKRAEYAKLLGYPTYAHLAMKSKMAENLENVHDMLETVLEKAKLGQETEIEELEKFAQNNYFRGQIELWDLSYWGRLQKKELYHFDEIALQEFFPLTQVLLGLFALCEQLFGIVIEEEKNVSVWHKDVKFYRVLDERTKQDVGGFYLDPYARKSKKMTPEDAGLCVLMSVSSKICNTLPSVSLIFDFAPPTENRPSLLLFREVAELFNKFGFALQHILSDTHFSEANCFSYMENDAKGICGKFLKHWLYERGTLESVSGHYNTGEPLPSHIVEGIGKMQHHMAGTELCKKIYRSHLDLQMCIDIEYCMPIAQRLWPNHFLFDLVDQDHHPFSYKDMIIGDSTCSYYSTVWSDIIAADAFHAFEEAGFRDQEEISLIGRRKVLAKYPGKTLIPSQGNRCYAREGVRFRSTYFALAGGCHPAEVFRKFRGRDPSPLPYLTTVGLKDLTPGISPTTEPEPSKIASN